IFSTGVLLYEMLTGTWPFQGKTSVDVRHAVLHEDPRPLSETRPGGAPWQLQAILDRAMAKEPKQRYQKVGEMRDDLRTVLREVEAGGAQTFEAITLIVRPSSEIARYQGVQVDPRQAGRDMSVSAVLSAGFLRGGNRIRVTAQLVDVASGDLLWSDRIDADATDIISVQDTITQEICE